MTRPTRRKLEVVAVNYDYNALAASMTENAQRLEAALDAYTRFDDKDVESITCAQRYSLLGAGKRIRPFLVCQSCRVLGGDEERAVPLAAALEMIHTYSLIHDDLPCMDDDDMRRGKPSCHKVFGYANALLAGDALLTRAFGVIADADGLCATAKTEAVSVLSELAGHRGMIGGQVIDLESEDKSIELQKLLKLHSLKTGALIRSAVLLGAIAAGKSRDDAHVRALCEYASLIGLAFQVIDDVLDVTSSEEALGKSIGSDRENGKTTFLSFYSVEGALEYAGELTQKAVACLDGIQGAESLEVLAYYLLERKN